MPDIIKFPKAKRPTPEEIKAIESVRANELLIRFAEADYIVNKSDRIDAFTAVRTDILNYVYLDMKEGVPA